MKTENPSIDESERKNADAVVQTSRSLDADAEQTPGKAFAETQAPMIDTIHLQHKELIQRSDTRISIRSYPAMCSILVGSRYPKTFFSCGHN